MSSLDVNDDLMTIIRLILSFMFIVVMIILFFSFQVGVINEDVQRSDMELADVLASSQLVNQRNVLSAQKLFQLPDEELFAGICEYEYTVEIKTVGSRKACSANNDCVDFCREVLNTNDVTDRYDCNFELRGQDYCECKSGDTWSDGYIWRFGQVDGKVFNSRGETFPTSLETTSGTLLPAQITIWGYDTLLSRLSCIAKKSYETKSNVTLNVDLSQLSLRSGGADTQLIRKENEVCLKDDVNENCRLMPNVPFDDFNINTAFGIIATTSKGSITSSGSTKGTITAYPLEIDATCEQAKKDLSVLAGFEENVQKIILCAESK